MKMKTTGPEALNLIKEQGTAFMRSIKIYETGKGEKKKFFIRPTINGKTLYVSFPSRETAEAFLTILPPATTNKAKKTFIDYFFLALEKIDIENTKKSYYYRLKDFDEITKKPVSTITKEDLENVFLKSKNSCWPQIHGVLKRVSRAADDVEFERVRVSVRDRFEYKSNKRRVEDPTGIISALLNIRLQKPIHERARLAFLIMCYTGLRVGELGCLRPEDVDKDFLIVRKTVVEGFTFSKGTRTTVCRTKVQNQTKGNEDRVIPLHQDVRDLFFDYFEIVKLRGDRSQPGSLTVKDPFLMHRKLLSESLMEVAKAAQLSEKVTPHTARHIFGTLYGNNCKDMADVMKLQRLLGHKNFETTQRYITLTQPTSNDIMGKMPTLRPERKKKLA